MARKKVVAPSQPSQPKEVKLPLAIVKGLAQLALEHDYRSMFQGWKLLSRNDEPSKHGFKMDLIFKKVSEPNDQAWFTVIEVWKPDEEPILSEETTFYRQVRVVRRAEFWERP